MKNKFLLPFALATLLCIAIGYGNAYAAFPVKKEESKLTSTKASAEQIGLTRYEKIVESLSKSKMQSMFCKPGKQAESKDGHNSDGWGALSIFCALTVVLAPLAIVFGIVGIHKNHKNAAAIIGLSLGILGTIAIVVVASMFSGGMGLGSMSGGGW